jgi:hypothetical protein
VPSHLVGGDSSAQFGVPVVAITIPATTVPVNGVASAQSFGTPTIQTAVSKPAGGVPTAQAFGAPTIRGAITRTVGAVSSAQAFGSLAFRVTLGSGGVLTAQAFGTPIPKAVITRTVTGLGSAQSFGAITTVTGPVSKPVGGVGSAQAFGAPLVSAGGIPPQGVPVTGVSSGSLFGVPTIRTVVTRVIVGFGSAQSFGSLLIAKGAVSRVVVGLGSAQSFGVVSTSITGGGLQTRAVVGLGSAQVFGAVTPKPKITKTVTGLGSAQQFGLLTPGAGSPQTVQVPGLQQGGSWGLSITGQVITGDGHRVLGGGGGLFGQVVIRTAVKTGVVNGVPSAQAFGIVQTTWPQWVTPAGCPSAALLGKPRVRLVWVNGAVCTDLDIAELLCEHETGTATVCNVGPPICGLAIIDEARFSTALSRTSLVLAGSPTTTLDLAASVCTGTETQTYPSSSTFPGLGPALTYPAGEASEFLEPLVCV